MAWDLTSEMGFRATPCWYLEEEEKMGLEN